MAQSVKHPASAQGMISPLMSSSPSWGSVLTARILESASDSVSPSLSGCFPAHALSLVSLSLSLSVSLSLKIKLKKKKKRLSMGLC